MSQKVQERTTSVVPPEPRPTREARRPRRGRVVAVVVAAVVVGMALGAVAYLAVADARVAARIDRAQSIQSDRWDSIIRFYERTWTPATAEPSNSGWRIAVTGTGPGLAFVADQQAAFGERAISGTGPGLATVAILQAGGTLGDGVAGTLGAEHLPGRAGSEWAMVGTP